MRVEPENSVAEKWTITCDNLTSSNTDKFILSLQSPNTSTLFNSDPIQCRNDAYTVYTKFQSFFQECGTAWGICGGINVYRTMYKADGTETTYTSQATKYVYTVYNRKRMPGSSFTSFKVTPVNTITAVVTVTPPYANNALGNVSSPSI